MNGGTWTIDILSSVMSTQLRKSKMTVGYRNRALSSAELDSEIVMTFSSLSTSFQTPSERMHQFEDNISLTLPSHLLSFLLVKTCRVEGPSLLVKTCWTEFHNKVVFSFCLFYGHFLLHQITVRFQLMVMI